MPRDEWLLAALKELGLSQCALARLLGVSDRTVRAWVSGGARLPAAVRTIVRSWLWNPSSMTDFRRIRELWAKNAGEN